jgi:hypothetical protein
MSDSYSKELNYYSIEKIQFWSSHIASFKKSRLNRRDYCKAHGLSYDAFFYWRKKLKASSSNATPSCISELVELPSIPMKLNNSFFSLGSDCSNSSAIRLSYREFSIELGNQFSPVALQNLLQVLLQL